MRADRLGEHCGGCIRHAVTDIGCSVKHLTGQISGRLSEQNPQGIFGEIGDHRGLEQNVALEVDVLGVAGIQEGAGDAADAVVGFAGSHAVAGDVHRADAVNVDQLGGTAHILPGNRADAELVGAVGLVERHGQVAGVIAVLNSFLLVNSNGVLLGVVLVVPGVNHLPNQSADVYGLEVGVNRDVRLVVAVFNQEAAAARAHQRGAPVGVDQLNVAALDADVFDGGAHNHAEQALLVQCNGLGLAGFLIHHLGAVGQRQVVDFVIAAVKGAGKIAVAVVIGLRRREAVSAGSAAADGPPLLVVNVDVHGQLKELSAIGGFPVVQADVGRKLGQVGRALNQPGVLLGSRTFKLIFLVGLRNHAVPFGSIRRDRRLLCPGSDHAEQRQQHGKKGEHTKQAYQFFH